MSKAEYDEARKRDQTVPRSRRGARLERWAKAVMICAAFGGAVYSGTRLLPAIERFFRVQNGMIEVEMKSLRTLDELGMRSPRRSDNPESVGQVRMGVLLVYNSNCMVCSLNIVNWLRLNRELIRELPNARVATLTIEPDSIAMAYLGPFEAFGMEHWRFRDREASRFKEVLGVSGVPATLVVRNDSIVAAFMGVMGPLRRRAVVRLVREGADK